MTIVMRRMKASPSGLIASPVLGETYADDDGDGDPDEHLSPQGPIERFPSTAGDGGAWICGGSGFHRDEILHLIRTSCA